ncbi:DUF1990 family protein [Paeniglutamicibacter kerguelensis]|uniref:Uncharacterized protein (DUF2236 family)/uncharacterized protein (UPF0548 family) n=1 Tax=Paeniglutamicibacter kerguelensis TaxID=254788 RepID=A0ABS4XKB6_9MICC|nr:DUF1990 family protein [Paeniglutamicibacter kerguelensis]MBP2388703.1 uncharacterized protein (DUF2236 family)/uncharacterized protein (UPF0548 family) [Paeniglutamicibacter kerguelensis]
MFEPLRHKLHQTFSAQETYDPVWERELDRGDDAGYFAHDSAVWVVHGGMSPMAAGIRALLTQALHPGALAGVAEHSNYQSDPLARLAGTIRWIFTLTYGDTQAARAACRWVQRRHVPVAGSYTSGAGDEKSYSANDPDLAAWVHIAFADAFLRSHEAFSGPVPQGADAYVREWAVAGELMGVKNPPRSEAELKAAIAGYEQRGELAGGPRVAEVVSFLTNPPLDPLILPGYKLLFAAVVGTLPESHRRMLGLERAAIGPVPLPSRLGGKAALGLAGITLAKKGPAELAARRRLFRLGVLNDLSYPEPGMTEHDEVPGGYGLLQLRERVGEGQAAFDALAEGLLTWELHRRSGLRTRPDTPRVQLGSRVELGFGFGPARITAPCRVVRLIEEVSRSGFAYGTLAGHPETGEESFAAVLGQDGSVYLEIRAVSKHSNRFYRLVSPAAEAAQRFATKHYVEAARRIAGSRP